GSPRYNRTVTTFYDIDEANARIPHVRELLTQLRDERDALIRLRDRSQEPDADEDERRRIHLRMQGIVDQMQAAVVRIDDWSITRRRRGQAWRRTSVATSSRRTNSSSRPGWAPTTLQSASSSRD